MPPLTDGPMKVTIPLDAFVHIRTAFEPARTVKTGKPSFVLKPITP